MVKRLFYIFLLLAPFTSFFAVSPWLRLPVVVNIVLLLITLVSFLKVKKIKLKGVKKEDLYLIVFLILVWVSFLLGFREKRSFNHSLAYTYAILLYFFLVKSIIQFYKISSIKIARPIYLSFLICSGIIMIDFVGKNFFGISFRQVFSTADGMISNMDYYIRAGLYRVGGVAEEPGSMALFYNVYFGIAMYYLYQKEKTFMYKWLLFIFIVCHFMMFSNAGIALFLIAGILVFTFNRLKRLTITKKQLNLILYGTIMIVLSFIVVLVFDAGNLKTSLNDFLNKILFSESHMSYSSSGQRLKQWYRAIMNFVKHPILGNGPGYGVDEDAEGYLSMYLTFLSDIGLVAFVFFIGFQEIIVKKVLSLPEKVRSFLLFSIITSFLHLIIVSDFYHAPFWILLAFIQLVYTEYKEKRV